MKIAKMLFAMSVVTLLGIGCAKAPTTNTNTNAPAAVGATAAKVASGTMTIVIMPDNTFEPTTAYVKVGTVLTFVNNSDKPHGIASNPHPKHTDLPSLDSKKSLAPGESYTYTFDKVGRWLFHDETNPAFGGAVMVSE